MSFQYPSPPATGGVTETIHGVTIHDPYRALEDDQSDSTKAFVKAQNELSIPHLESHPRREHIRNSIAASYDRDSMTCPERQADGWYYWLFNDGTLPRDIVVRSRDLARGYGKRPSAKGPELVFDPSKEEHTSLYWQSWSPSGRFWNLILQESGSDWQKIRTIDTHTMEATNEDLTESMFTFGGCWIGERGFLYKKLIGAGQFGIYYHELGTAQTADVLIWQGSDAQFVNHPRLCTAGSRTWIVFDIYYSVVQEADNFMIELPSDPSGQEIARLVKNEQKWLCKGCSGTMRYIGSTLSSEKHLFLSTYDGCSTGRVVSVDAQAWDETAIDQEMATSVLVPVHPEGLTLSSANLVGGRVLVLVYLRDACAHVVYIDASTGEPIAASQGVPPNSSVSTVTSSDSNEFFLAVESFLAPPVIIRGVVNIQDTTPLVADITFTPLGHLAPASNQDLVTRQIMYPSHDGTSIPMFISHAHGLDMTKEHPVLLHGYGGFQVANTPSYSPFWPAFIRQVGGIVAIACIRGGGEYGKDWHEAAKGIKRSVAWDDFAAAARYLHAEKLSVPRLTTTYGTSNGGLLVSACVNRYPELFGAVLCDVGVTDLVRYHKFTIGRLWVSEYGDPDSPDHLPILAATSPLHNLNKHAEYPAILVTTADHDTRVVPSHSLKYLAALQATKADNPNIFLGRIYENTGHSAEAKSRAQLVEELVDRVVFVLKNLDRE